MDDTHKRGAADRRRIAMNQEYEVRYWTQKLGVSREELEAAVNTVGNEAEKVEEHLRGHRQGGVR
jgi:hypothetical protein